MNALQYYIIDGFIKNQKPAKAEANEDGDRIDGDGRTQRPRAEADEGQNGIHEDDATIRSDIAVAANVEDKPLLANGVTKLKISPKRLEEYDPATDGESSPAPSEFRRRNSPSTIQTADRHEQTTRHSNGLLEANDVDQYSAVETVVSAAQLAPKLFFAKNQHQPTAT
ncbi:MAG: hypothetical protein Q9219_005193 [cf. Caloplaca sp. 3 TL-2023]